LVFTDENRTSPFQKGIQLWKKHVFFSRVPINVTLSSKKALQGGAKNS
jgi:hypothetical protein